jgi:hypothetical protein
MGEARLAWTYDRAQCEWHSICGRYAVWLQARPVHGGQEWAAKVQTPGGTGKHQGGTCTWLAEHEGTRLQAMAVCQAHADVQELEHHERA